MENKNEMQSEERIDLETWREDVGDEIASALQDKDQLLHSIRRTRESFQKEAASGEPKHAPAFYQVLDGLFERFEKQMEYVNLPDLPEPHEGDDYAECWSYAYEIENCGLKLSLVRITWFYHDGGASSDMEQPLTANRNVPARLLTISDYAKLYGLELEDAYGEIDPCKQVEGVVMMNGEWYISELLEPSDLGGGLNIMYCS